ncbi:MAG: (2Fe-2S) ferredoxin domain-containing protein [Geitlerinemataceae cyanobacterium]
MSDNPQQVLVCQNRTCKRQGSAEVLAAFQSQSIVGISVRGSGCLGQCGNGPMVLILPEEIWYSKVHPGEVIAIVEQHLLGGKPVNTMLYRKFHPRI